MNHSGLPVAAMSCARVLGLISISLGPLGAPVTVLLPLAATDALADAARCAVGRLVGVALLAELADAARGSEEWVGGVLAERGRSMDAGVACCGMEDAAHEDVGVCWLKGVTAGAADIAGMGVAGVAHIDCVAQSLGAGLIGAAGYAALPCSPHAASTSFALPSSRLKLEMATFAEAASDCLSVLGLVPLPGPACAVSSLEGVLLFSAVDPAWLLEGDAWPDEVCPALESCCASLCFKTSEGATMSAVTRGTAVTATTTWSGSCSRWLGNSGAASLPNPALSPAAAVTESSRCKRIDGTSVNLMVGLALGVRHSPKQRMNIPGSVFEWTHEAPLISFVVISKLFAAVKVYFCNIDCLIFESPAHMHKTSKLLPRRH